MSLAKLAAALLLVYLSVKLYRWYARRRKLVQAIEQLPGVPAVPMAPILNHAVTLIYLDLIDHRLGTFVIIYYLLSTVYALFPEQGICTFWVGWRPFVMLFAPENVEAILTSTTVLNKGIEYSVFEPWIGEGLVTSKRNKWRFRRKILTPAFHFRILNDFLPVMNQEASKLVRKFNQEKYLKQVFDVSPVIALCTLDTICETAMGVNMNSQDEENSIYVQSLKELAEMALTRVARPWLWSDFVFYRTEAGKRFTKAKDVMHAITTKVILDRKADWERMLADRPSTGKEANITFDDVLDSTFFKSGDKKLAFLDLMLHQHLIENNMSIDDIREEVDTFMFAGHDTTAMNISWTLYMLGLHPEIQDKVREELDRIFKDDNTGELARPSGATDEASASRLKTTDVTTEHIREMKYLDRVIKESLRMWPAIPFVARNMTEDILVGEQYLVPKGSTCVVFTHALHNNPKYFLKPEVFDPDRFLPENSIGRHPFAFVPFSAGPRNCIGQKFAQMEVKVILAKIIRNYCIKTRDHRDKLELVGELVLRARNGLNISLSPRFER